MTRRDVVGRLAALAALPFVASCGVDRLLQPSFAVGDPTLPIRLIGGGDPHLGITSLVPRRVSDHINTMLTQDPRAIAYCVGDLAKNGAPAQYQDLYHQSWGRFKSRTLPVPGNHDIEVSIDPTGKGYYDYWAGMGVGERGVGSYVKTLGDHWVVFCLNSQQARPTQAAWLKAELPKYANRHIMAMCHFPFLGNPCNHGGTIYTMDWPSDQGVGQFTGPLEAAGCELYVAGHCHTWFRTPRLIRNTRSFRQPIVSERGMRQFVVGTGGTTLMTPASIHPLMDASKTPGGRTITGMHGITEFALYPDRYEWKFTQVTSTGLGAVRDSGTQLCRKTLVV